MTESIIPITKQATNPLTRVPHPNEEDSTTYKNQSTWTTVAPTSRFFQLICFYLSNKASFFVSTIIPTKSTSQFVHHWSKWSAVSDSIQQYYIAYGACDFDSNHEFFCPPMDDDRCWMYRVLRMTDRWPAIPSFYCQQCDSRKGMRNEQQCSFISVVSAETVSSAFRLFHKTIITICVWFQDIKRLENTKLR